MFEGGRAFIDRESLGKRRSTMLTVSLNMFRTRLPDLQYVVLFRDNFAYFAWGAGLEFRGAFDRSCISTRKSC